MICCRKAAERSVVNMSEAYKAAGVDVEAGYESVRLMKEHV